MKSRLMLVWGSSPPTPHPHTAGSFASHQDQLAAAVDSLLLTLATHSISDSLHTARLDPFTG